MEDRKDQKYQEVKATILKSTLDQSVIVQELENLKSWHPYLENRHWINISTK